jgi:hypothetical protein
MLQHSSNYFCRNMRKFLLVGYLLSGVLFIAQAQEKYIKKYSDVLSPLALKQQLSIIAGPEMEGRETATEGERRAAAYVESQMKAIGLQPGNGSTYQMHFPVYQDSTIEASVLVNGKSLEWNKDFTARNENYTSQMGFTEIQYLNLEDTAWKADKINIAGKLVMVKLAPAKGRAARYALLGQLASIEKKGAAAILIVDSTDKLAKVENPSAAMRINKFAAAHAANRYTITASAATAIAGTNRLDTCSSKIFTAEIELSFKGFTLQKSSSNVLGILPGSGKTDEWLVITAHYDHIGKRDTVIWYGADDDGSGTATVIELAKAFTKAKADGFVSPRNILFMTVSGEEKGLLGSKYFTENPTVPLNKVTVNLNIDMVGRIDSLYDKKENKNYVYLVGDDKLSTELTPVSKEANKSFGLILDPKFNDPKDRERIYYRSDHYNFAKKGVPVMFYYDGGHRDYHRPTDTVDKINFDLMSLRARFIFTTAWLIAYKPQMLKRDLELSAVGTR